MQPQSLQELHGAALLEELEELQALKKNAASGKTGPTGPRTPEGKKRSSLNSWRHGLTGQINVLTEPDRVAFDKHVAGLVECHKPIGHAETDLVQSIAEHQWRLKRARALENSIFAMGLDDPMSPVTGHEEVDTAFAQACVWLKEGKNLQLLTLYEQRIQRAAEKNTAELRMLQAERKAEAAKTLEEILKLARLAWMLGKEYDPANDLSGAALATPDAMARPYPHNGQAQSNASGQEFVCSTLQVAKIVDREERLKKATWYEKHDWDAKCSYPEPAFIVPKAA